MVAQARSPAPRAAARAAPASKLPSITPGISQIAASLSSSAGSSTSVPPSAAARRASTTASAVRRSAGAGHDAAPGELVALVRDRRDLERLGRERRMAGRSRARRRRRRARTAPPRRRAAPTTPCTGRTQGPVPLPHRIVFAQESLRRIARHHLGQDLARSPAGRRHVPRRSARLRTFALRRASCTRLEKLPFKGRRVDAELAREAERRRGRRALGVEGRRSRRADLDRSSRSGSRSGKPLQHQPEPARREAGLDLAPGARPRAISSSKSRVASSLSPRGQHARRDLLGAHLEQELAALAGHHAHLVRHAPSAVARLLGSSGKPRRSRLARYSSAQPIARSRTRFIRPTRSVTETAPRASSRLKRCEHLRAHS